MKIFSPILLIAGLQFSAMAKGQTKLTLSIKNSTLPAAIESIENNSDYHFVYNNNILPEDKKVNAEFVNADIAQVLNTLLQGTGLNYNLTETNLIVLFKKEAGQQPEHPISGKVTDENGKPLPGASISIKGTTNGTSTNATGEFSLIVPDSAILVVSYIGYDTKEVIVGNQTTLQISLTASTKVAEEVIVVGYGTQRKIDVTSSIAHVNGTELAKQPVSNATQALQGLATGIQISSSGQPGSQPQVIIRGAGSILGGVSPLYVVDGVPIIDNDISSINSADIASIDILKDASSCAIYGARAANGVILITTKQGSGKMKVTYTGTVGISQPANVMQMANTQQYVAYRQAITFGLPFPNDNSTYNTNWFNEIFRNAFQQNHNITLSGSSEKDRYLFGISYLNQDGIIINNNYQRYTVRFNNDYTPANFVKIGTGISYENNAGQNVPNSITFDAYRAVPIVPALVDGKYGNTSAYQNVGNAVLDASQTNDRSNDNDILGNVYIEIKPIKHLSIKSSFGGDFKWHEDRQYTYEQPNDTSVFFYLPGTDGGSQGPSFSTLATTDNKFWNWVWDNTVDYNQEFGKSKLGILAGVTSEKYYSTGQALSIRNVPTDPDLWYIQNGDPTTLKFNVQAGIPNEWTRSGYLGRITYSYDDRYLLTANFRADASSVFSQSNRWGYFPGISAGWVLTKEKFMENQKIFQYLKFRAGWGQLGNSNIPSDAAFTTLYSGTGSAYFFNSGSTGTAGGTQGTISPQIKANNIKWEITNETDIGLEFGALQNKLTGEIDVYDKRVNNALIYTVAAGTFGAQANPASTIQAGYILYNAAVIDNKGLEMLLRWHDKISKNFSYSLSGNISLNKNNVVSLANGVPLPDVNVQGVDVTNTTVGAPIGSFFVRKVIGVNQDPTSSTEGQFIYQKDTSGKFVMVNAGSYIPKLYGGFTISLNYKAFDFSTNIYYNIGNQVYDELLNQRTQTSDNVPAYIATSAWTPSNHSNSQPIANGGGFPPSTYFVYSGTFYRINNITVGYTIPSSHLGKTISSFRVYVSAQNPITIKKYPGLSAELPGTTATNAGVDYNTYPTIKTYVVGVNLGL